MTESGTLERVDAATTEFVARLREIVGSASVETSVEQRQFFSLDFSEEPGAVAMSFLPIRSKM